MTSGAQRLLFTLLAIAACARPPDNPPSSPPALAEPAIELVETAPVETTLDHPDIPNAHDVWIEMIDRARTSLDFAEFYASDEAGSRLSRVVLRVEAAAARGVRVRFLVEKVFLAKYPDTVARLRRASGIEVRVFDMSREMGGILHAKYFVVDGREAFVGSQNFDWRALEHIQEMGVRLREPAIVGALAELFLADWDVTGGAGLERYHARSDTRWQSPDGSIELTASPRGFLTHEGSWDLPRIVDRLDGARTTVAVQLLTYKARTRKGAPFTELDLALRRAAARGVSVRLLVSEWGAKDESLRALAGVPNVKVSILTIPRWSGGEIAFARVAHAKYMVVDGAEAWIGTSNWEGDYFTESRNVGVFTKDPGVAQKLARVFEDGWRDYAKPLAVAP